MQEGSSPLLTALDHVSAVLASSLFGSQVPQAQTSSPQSLCPGRPCSLPLHLSGPIDSRQLLLLLHRPTLKRPRCHSFTTRTLTPTNQFHSFAVVTSGAHPALISVNTISDRKQEHHLSAINPSDLKRPAQTHAQSDFSRACIRNTPTTMYGD